MLNMSRGEKLVYLARLLSSKPSVDRDEKSQQNVQDNQDMRFEQSLEDNNCLTLHDIQKNPILTAKHDMPPENLSENVNMLTLTNSSDNVSGNNRTLGHVGLNKEVTNNTDCIDIVGSSKFYQKEDNNDECNNMYSDNDPYETDEDDEYIPSDKEYSSSDSDVLEPVENVNIDVLEEEQAEQSMTVNEEKKTRKRKRKENHWRRNVIKSLRNTGKTYKNWKDNIVAERKLKPACDINKCRFKCASKYSEEERLKLFEEYWKLGDVNRQRDLIARFVEFKDKKRETVTLNKLTNATNSANTKSRRNKTFFYYLPKNESENLRVCQTFFINTFSISYQVVKTVAKKLNTTSTISPDHRGQVQCNSRLPEYIKQSVRDHIEKFDTVDSHYCRRNSIKKYLPASLNISRMYNLYKDYCAEIKIENFANEHLYRKIFNEEYNLSFHIPKKDQCDFCTKFNNSSAEDKHCLQNEFERHMENKEQSRNAKTFDKERGKTDSNFSVCVYDLQQVLNCPKMEASQLYYKRKLATYNLTMYDISNNSGFCYMWHEAVASRGACEVGSCVFNFIQMKVKEGKKEFVFYSDNCSGQNHNRFIYCIYMYCANKFKVIIKHNFLEKGHTQNEGDSVHSTIEKAAKNITVYTPEQWYTVARMACKKKPYNVKEMAQKDFFDLKDLLSKTTKNWQKNMDGDSVMWQKIKIVSILPDDPYKLYYKYNYNEGYSTICVVEKDRKKLLSFDNYKFKNLHNAAVPISKAKFLDLQKLCTEKLIPVQYHDFFLNLKYTSVQNKQVEEEN